jgi:hypothetical protein
MARLFNSVSLMTHSMLIEFPFDYKVTSLIYPFKKKGKNIYVIQLQSIFALICVNYLKYAVFLGR